MRRVAALLCLWTTAVAAPCQALRTFVARNGTFQIDLPADWRELSPSEARTLAARPGAPAELGYVEPRAFYAIGPVDAWLRGEFDGPWLWVVEQGNEWLIGDDFAAELTEMWREKGERTGVTHTVSAVRRQPIGAEAHEALVALRTTTTAAGVAQRSLDVHAPTAGREVSLSFTSPLASFDRWHAEFERWLATLRFARRARGTPTLTDRLWTPLLTGGVVTLLLVVLYRQTRRRS